jgi:hypothetical protein
MPLHDLRVWGTSSFGYAAIPNDGLHSQFTRYCFLCARVVSGSISAPRMSACSASADILTGEFHGHPLAKCLLCAHGSFFSELQCESLEHTMGYRRKPVVRV